jgi:tetratricopeptide (TPR) repeat protein
MSRVNAGDEIGRNDPCPCGSGRKYKKCCMGRGGPRRAAATPPRAGTREDVPVAQEHARAGRLPEAKDVYEQVLRSRPDDVQALNGLADVEGRLGRPAESVRLLRRAIAADERHHASHVMLCQMLLRVGDFDGATQSARRAVDLDPNNEAGHRMLADCHYRMRRFDEAIGETKKALALDPGSVNAEFFLAVLLEKKGALNEARQRLEELIARGLGPDLLHRAQRELGFVLDRLGEHEAAFALFEQAGAERAGMPEARGIDGDQPLNLAAAYRRVATTELLSKWSSDAFDDDLPRPSFLVGFPRSGTTLTEQIMAAHPDVVTTDEKMLIRDVKTTMLEWFAENNAPAVLAQLDRDDILRLRAEYWKRAQGVVQTDLSDKVFVDKLPLNLIDLPLINVLFPEARVIVALRDPRDVCLSCFMQLFGLNTAMVNFLSWERTAAFYAAVMDLWLYLRDKMTLQYLEIRYEDTVDDFPRQARALIDFLGVAWDEGVLAFHEGARQRFISTPSAAAVSQPVHRGALARWRRYPAATERVSETLARFVTAFGYD